MIQHKTNPIEGWISNSPFTAWATSSSHDRDLSVGINRVSVNPSPMYSAERAYLLPQPDHLRHLQHRLATVLQTRLHRTLPLVTLDFLPDTSTLDLQSALRAPGLLVFCRLATRRQQRLDVIFDGEFHEIGLCAQPKARARPLAGAEVLVRQERIGVFGVGVEEGFGGREFLGVGVLVALGLSVGNVWRGQRLFADSFCRLLWGSTGGHGGGIDLRRIAGEEVLKAGGQLAHQAGGRLGGCHDGVRESTPAAKKDGGE